MKNLITTILVASLALTGCGRNNQQQAQQYPNQGGQPVQNYPQNQPYPNDPNYQQGGYQQGNYQQGGYVQNGYPQQNNTGNVVAGVAAGAAAGALATHAYHKYKNNQIQNQSQSQIRQPTNTYRNNANVATTTVSNRPMTNSSYANRKFTPTSQRPSYVRRKR